MNSQYFENYKKQNHIFSLHVEHIKVAFHCPMLWFLIKSVLFQYMLIVWLKLSWPYSKREIPSKLTRYEKHWLKHP